MHRHRRSGQTEPIWGRPWSFYAGVGSPPLIGLTVSMLLSNYLGLSKPQCVSVSIETCYQNTGVALTVALSSFHGETQVLRWKNCGNRRDFGWEVAHEAVSRRPPISLDVIVARTLMYTRDAKVWDLSIVQGLLSVAPCRTVAIRNCSSLCTTRCRCPCE